MESKDLHGCPQSLHGCPQSLHGCPQSLHGCPHAHGCGGCGNVKSAPIEATLHFCNNRAQLIDDIEA